ncbi:DUF397 domain-containing protein [Streptomyces sp. NPDC127098]|uniref:DUF397 domain-containing protein n=1 Tax=Streptomyces sp. NPDC127098 TaxID=3347137 RepID=UPI0036522A7E
MTPDLSEAAWFKSSYSDGNGGTCVEVADFSHRVGVRDSRDTGIAPFTVPKAAWASFVGQLRRAG